MELKQPRLLERAVRSFMNADVSLFERGRCSMPTEETQTLVRILVVRYGSIHKAGKAYDERFGYRGKFYAHRNGGRAWKGNGDRLFTRILNGETKTVSDRSYDQIETLVAS
jgi:hypothetical protein